VVFFFFDKYDAVVFAIHLAFAAVFSLVLFFIFLFLKKVLCVWKIRIEMKKGWGWNEICFQYVCGMHPSILFLSEKGKKQWTPYVFEVV
jgi:hypothetical protein